jgi:methylase of polypeptide subunit release factors
VTPTPHLSDDGVRRLRASFEDAEYSVDGVLDVLGAPAYSALARNEVIPALRVTEGGSSLETLIRLFLLQTPVRRADAANALPLDELVTGGLVQQRDDSVVASIDVRPYASDSADWWIVSDLSAGVGTVRGPVAEDHVLGVGGASTTLAQITVREPVLSALDLGTGCGVQALHLSEHAQRITATDRNPRALALAGMTARLSDVPLQLLEGDLLAPVQGRRFDLVVSNPPFVVSPVARFAYRDSGLPGDELSRRLVGDTPTILEPGGWCQLLVNWLHVRDSPWIERVESWLEPTGCDAWVVQREVQDPAEYVELWLRDSGDAMSSRHAELYDAWLDWFDTARVDAIGFGWVTLRRSEVDQPVVRIEDWPHAVAQPLGPAISSWFRRQDWLRSHADDAALLATRLRRSDDVVQEQYGEPGAEHPARIALRQQQGMRRAIQVDTVQAALVGACDGSVPLVALIDAIASLVDDDAARLRSELPTSVRSFVTDGLLEPA